MKSVHKSLGLLGVTAMALLIGACGQQAQQQEKAAAKADVGAIADAIKTDEKAWNDEFKAKNLEALVAHYASDARFVAPGVKPASGSADIHKAYEDALKDPNFTVSFASDKIDVAGSGDLAYARGRFSESYTDPATKQSKSDSGSYVTVYKKQADGSWKAVEDFAAADPAR